MKRLIENAVKDLIRNFAESLPVVVQVEFFKALSRRLDVESVLVRGDNGVFEGSAVDFLMGSYIGYKVWAPELIDLMTNRIFSNKSGTYLDIGANIGLTTIPIANAGNISCHCFEPDPVNFGFLKHNIEMNAVDKKISLHNYALFSRNCTLEFEVSADNKGDHRIRGHKPKVPSRQGELKRNTISVDAKALDSVFSIGEFRRPVVAKIDAQGSEVEIFRGGSGFFSEIDYLIVEFWPYGLLRMGSEVSEFYEFIGKFPYGTILNSGGGHIPQLKPTAGIIEETKLDRKFLEGGTGNKHIDILLSVNSNLPA